MNPNGRPRKAIKARLLEKVKIEAGMDACWLWQGQVLSNGYGQIWVGDRYRMAHRVSYAEFIGPIEDGRHIHHRCRNKNCIRPEHLEMLSASEHSRKTNAFEASRVVWRDRTHCKHGHPFEGENLLFDKKGMRVCRACKNRRGMEANRVRRALAKENPGPGRGSQWSSKTHCPQGHPYEGHNLILRYDGARTCRECKNAEVRRRKRKADPAPPGSYNRLKTHCKQGHEYTPENTYVYGNGSRGCKVCRTEAARRYRGKKKE